MENVLFILDNYLPKASANGICISNIAREYCKQSKNINILAYGDEESCQQTGNVTLFTIKREERKGKLRPVKFYLSWLLPSCNPAGTNKKTVQRLVDKAKSLIAEHNITTVVCVYLPNEALCAGKTLKLLFPDICFVAYMLDSCSGGFLPRFLPKGYTLARKLRWEEKLLNVYDKIILMGSGRAHYMKHCKEKTWFSKAVFSDVPMFLPKDTQAETHNDDVVFVGTLADGVRTPDYFLKVLDHMDTPVTVVFAGKDYCKKPKQTSNELITIRELGVVSHREAESLIADGGFLLNIGNNNPNLVPSKIFEYMAMGKPIISTFCSDNDTSMAYLSKYPNVIFLDEREKDYGKAAARLKEFIKTAGSVKIDPEQLNEVFYEATPAAFIAKLDK